MKIDPVIEKVAGFIAENSTTILTATGIASFISSTAFAIKSTRDAAWVYEKASDEAMYMDCSKVRKMAHVAKAVVPLYIPTAVTAGIGILCVAMANKINLDDKAALVAAYSMSKDALDSYQKNVSKRLGQEAHEDILDSIAEEDKGQFDDDIWLDAPGAGSVRVYDHVTGVRFFSDKAKIEQAEARIVKRLLDEPVVRLNELYYELGVDDVSNIGDALGWDVSRCTPKIYFTSMLSESGVPCLVINYDVCMVSPRMLKRNGY